MLLLIYFFYIGSLKEVIMLSVGIDVSKGESMVCALNQFGKVVLTPVDTSM